MGKKRDLTERPKSGPGRKSKKQPPPELPKQLISTAINKKKKLSHRQQIRLKKRIARKDSKAEKNDQEVHDEENDQDLEDDQADGISQPEQPAMKDKSKTKVSKTLGSDGGSQSEESSNDEEDAEQDSPELESGQSIDEEEDGGELQDQEEELLPIEQAALKRDERTTKIRERGEAEMKASAAAASLPQPFPDDVTTTDQGVPDIPALQHRIQEILEVLADFSARRDPQRTRQEYVSMLILDLCTVYSYNQFLMTKLYDLFTSQILEFLDANDSDRPVTIRTNTIKARRRDLAQALINRGVNLDPIGAWSKVGLVVFDSRVPLGATPEYLAGHYMLQSGASFLPVMALAPHENDKILDLCAAPGGKTSYIAQLMKNTGCLFANDASKDRARAIVANLHRLGVINTVVSVLDGRHYPKIMKGFDRVLVDAPCSGSGVISKDPSVKVNKDEKDIMRCSHLQKELLLAAIDCCDAKSAKAGYIVYSTCSILVEENECVVNYAVKKRNVKIVSTGLEFGHEGFTKFRQHRLDQRMNLTRRYYPHTTNLDGFFVAKLKKLSNDIPNSAMETSKEHHDEEDVEAANDSINSTWRSTTSESAAAAAGATSSRLIEKEKVAAADKLNRLFVNPTRKLSKGERRNLEEKEGQRQGVSSQSTAAATNSLVLKQKSLGKKEERKSIGDGGGTKLSKNEKRRLRKERKRHYDSLNKQNETAAANVDGDSAATAILPSHVNSADSANLPVPDSNEDRVDKIKSAALVEPPEKKKKKKISSAPTAGGASPRKKVLSRQEVVKGVKRKQVTRSEAAAEEEKGEGHKEDEEMSRDNVAEFDLSFAEETSEFFNDLQTGAATTGSQSVFAKVTQAEKRTRKRKKQIER